jgi:hypothetical protein
LTPSTIRRQRLARQQLAASRFATPAELVRWMGAVQAQDYLGGLWGVGLRVRGATEADVEAALAARAIVRTWPMRGTLHFVHAADARWMLRLLAPRMIARAAGRYRELELDEAAFKHTRTVLGRALRDGRRITRGQAYAALERGGVSPQGQRGIHILSHLSQHRVLCFGPREGRQATFVLLDEWLPAAADPPREQALAMLAKRYFASHGPATVHDFAWWAGLVMKDAHEAIGGAGSRLAGETWRGRRWWWSAATATAPTVTGAAVKSPAAPVVKSPAAVLLPPWDEYLVAYKDRAMAGDAVAIGRDPSGVIGAPVVLIDGIVRGTWKRSLATSAARITLEPWTRVTKDERRALEKAAARYGRFLGREVEVRWAVRETRR